MEIRDLWRVVGPFSESKEWGLEVGLRRLVRLKSPVMWKQLRADPYSRELAVVRAAFTGRRDITDDWPLLYHRIVEQNPGVKKILQPYAWD